MAADLREMKENQGFSENRIDKLEFGMRSSELQIAEKPEEGELVILRSTSDEESLANFFEILRRIPLLRMTPLSMSRVGRDALIAPSAAGIFDGPYKEGNAGALRIARESFRIPHSELHLYFIYI